MLEGAYTQLDVNRKKAWRQKTTDSVSKCSVDLVERVELGLFCVALGVHVYVRCYYYYCLHWTDSNVWKNCCCYGCCCDWNVSNVGLNPNLGTNRSTATPNTYTLEGLNELFEFFELFELFELSGLDRFFFDVTAL